MSELTAGSRLGAFEVGDLLGEGGMGKVYQARDTKLGRDVGLKVLPEAFTSDPRVRPTVGPPSSVIWVCPAAVRRVRVSASAGAL